MQNFYDLERASSSTAALWLALGRDIVTTAWAHWVDAVYDGPGSFTRQSRIIGVALAMILVIAAIRHPEHWLIALAFCGGYAIGWLGGWSRKRAFIVLTVIAVVCAMSTHQRVLLTISYGCTLGGLTGWRGRTKSMSGLRNRGD